MQNKPMSLLVRLLSTTAITVVMSGAASAKDPAVTTTKNDAAAYSLSGGATKDVDITATANTTTANKRAWGILVTGSSTLTTKAVVTTTGDKAHGVQSGNKGANADGTDKSKISLEVGTKVTTNGQGSYGLHAIDGGAITGTAVIDTTGVAGFGVFAESYSTIDLVDSKITTGNDYAYGLIANNDRIAGTSPDAGAKAGVITATNTDILTGGAWAHGVYADAGSTITITGGTVKTTGERAYGLQSGKGSTLTSSAVITTTGSKAHGVQAGENGSTGTGNANAKVILTSGSQVNTGANDAFGLHAVDGGTITGTTVINTVGTNGFGAFAESNSTIDLTGSKITTAGDYAYGLIANNDRKSTAGVITATNTDIVTGGAWAHGVYADAGSTITVEGGSVTTSKERAFGLLSGKGSTLTSNAVITTTGSKAHGVQAGENGSTGTGGDKAKVILTKGSVVNTGANDAFGLHAVDGGTITGTTVINTVGTNGFGAFAESNSTIDLTGSKITTAGDYAYGLIANNDRKSTAGVITATNTDIVTDGAWAHGVYADAGSTIKVEGGSVTTSKERAFGLLSGKGSTLTSSTVITTTGSKAHGVQAGENGSTGTGGDNAKVILTSGSQVNTGKNDAFGLHAVDGGTITGTTEINTTGTNGFGAFAESFSTIDLVGSKITTGGDYAYGLIANNDRIAGKNPVAGAKAGVITATNTDIVTGGAWAHGVYADAGSTITVEGGSVTTSKERAFGLLSGKGSTLTSNAVITTTGSKAHGVQAGENGSTGTGGDKAKVILTKGSVVKTEGNDAFGLHAVDGGTITGTTVINTTGTNGFGAFAESFSTIDLTGSTIITKEANAYGLIANNDRKTGANPIANAAAGTVTVTDTEVLTSGAGAHGALVKDGGMITINGGSITANGENAAALAVVGSGTINVNGATLTSKSGPTIAAVLSSATDVANIKLGSGTVATVNDGTLLLVERSNGAGAAGTVNLTLAAGSTSKGDILDEGAKTGEGRTNFVVEKNASWTGIAKGLKDLNAADGSTIAFSGHTNIEGAVTGNGSTFIFDKNGATIAGLVNLTNGTVVSGGHTAPMIAFNDVNVDETSTLGGNWDIRGDLAANGTIAPGNSIGLIKVAGDATFAKGSTYAVEVAPNGTNDRIDVAGEAIIDGGLVTITALVDDKKSYTNGRVHTILTAGQGVTGTFDDVESKSIFLNAKLIHQANQVDVKLSIVHGGFQTAAITANQFAAAGALNSLGQEGSSLALYNSLLAIENTATARAALTQLSGDVYGSYKAGLIETAHLTEDAINNRIRSAFENGSANDTATTSDARVNADYGLWATGFGSWVKQDGNANAGGLSTSTGGFISGTDIGFASGWRLGLAGGYSQTDLKAKNRSASANSDNWHLGIYGGNQWGPVGLRAGLIHTWHSIDSSRSVISGDLANSLSADYKARTLQAFGELGYRIESASATFEPFANLSHVRLRTEGVNEKGGQAALNIQSDTTNTTFTTLGLRAVVPVELGSSKVNFKGTAGWRHAYGDVTPSSINAYGTGDTFVVDGTPIAKDAALIEAGFDIGITQATTFGVNYVGQYGSGTKQNGFTASFNTKF